MEKYQVTPFVTWVMEQTDNIGLNAENVTEVFISQRFGRKLQETQWLPYVQRVDAFGARFWTSALGEFICKSDETTTLHDIQEFIVQTYGENTP